MNMHEIHDEYQPDEATAHFVALHKMRQEDLRQGKLACVDYAIEYDRELGICRSAPPVFLSQVLKNLPSIRSDRPVTQHLIDSYVGSGLEIPTGLLDLPLQWAKAFHEIIQDTHWPNHPHCTIRDVLGWSQVLRFGGYLDIQFEEPLPHGGSHWNDVGEFILELHRRFEPGIYTPPGRLIEFI